MILSQLKLDEEAELEFAMQIFGTTESSSDIRFVIEGADYDIILHGTYENGNVKVRVPKMKNIMPSGIHECKMEVIVDGKVFTPLNESIEFAKLVEVDVKRPTVESVKESVTIEPIKVTTKSTSVNKIDEAKSEGYEIAEYAGYNILKKNDRFYGFVTETKLVKAKQSYATIPELVESLSK